MLLAVDGDTISCDGVAMRDIGAGEPNISGYDAPQIERSACFREQLWGEQARDILQDMLIRPGTTVEATGASDSLGMPLVSVRLADGTTAGEALIRLGYAVPWKPGDNYAWCANL
jgi:endonuclease YncB( thermonuclease family)